MPVSTSPKGRLALTAARVFGAQPYDAVTVGGLAREAGVTTGALYHHFESKLGLYEFVRRDVERRVLDRMEGAAAAYRTDGAPGAWEPVRAALLVGFDFAVRQDFTWLLGEAPPRGTEDLLVDLLADLCSPAPAPLARIAAAAWRAALITVAEGGSPEEARAALAALQVTPSR